MAGVLMYMTYWGRLRDLFLLILVEWLRNRDPDAAYSYFNAMINMELFLVLINSMARRKSHILQFGKVHMSSKKMSHWLLWIRFPKDHGIFVLGDFQGREIKTWLTWPGVNWQQFHSKGDTVLGDIQMLSDSIWVISEISSSFHLNFCCVFFPGYEFYLILKLFTVTKCGYSF